jgi:ribonucleoside-triphosphate reductase
MNIIKREGQREKANPEKIKAAIKAAFSSVGYDLDEETYDSIVSNVSLWEDITIDEIQDEVDETLREFGYDDVANSYTVYRAKKDEARKMVNSQIDFMLEYINSKENAATSSNTDGNANITIKNVSNLESEVPKDKNRLIQRAWMKRSLKKLYPELAKQYERDISHHIIYPHDEASSPAIKNYCEAVSLYPLATDGTSSMDGTGTKPPEHLSTFAGQMCNLLFLLSSQCKGAVAFGEFFNFFDYYAVKDYGEHYHFKADLYADTEYVNNRKTIGQKIDQAFQQIVYFWNQPAGNRGSQSPFSNISYYDENYWHALFDDFQFPDGTKPNWERIDWLQRRFIKWFNEERSKVLLTFPVETMALLTDGKDVIDKSYKELAAEMWEKGHSFFVYLSDNPDSLASCCRLRNKIQENTFSFTNGLTGVQTGSCNVITLNLNRITQDYFKKYSNPKYENLSEEDMEGFKAYLTEIVERVQKYHIAYKTNLYMFEKAGQLTASTAGYISMNKLYSTIGLNGINEAAMFLGIDVSYNDNYKNFCRFITGTISDLNKKNSTPSFQFNQEFVPAESLGSKNFLWDLKDGYWVPNDGRVLYNSYFYDAHDNTSVLDRMKMHGKEFTELLDGGVGCHLNLEDHLTKQQYLTLIDRAIEWGTSYFTFNIPNTQCDECGYISKHRLKECPKCGSKKLTWWTRVIGFLRPTKTFDKYRKIEENQRNYAKYETT